jgi:hypothetical protein
MVRTTKGAARPSPRVAKTRRMTGVELARAKPTAVPRNGAEQGVARIGQSEQGEDDARRVSGAVKQQMAAVFVDDVDEGEDFDREHGKHTGHQVEEHASEESQ